MNYKQVIVPFGTSGLFKKLQRAVMPSSTVERVDCIVAEQYNIRHCEVNPRFQRNDATSLGLLAVIEGIMAS